MQQQLVNKIDCSKYSNWKSGLCNKPMKSFLVFFSIRYEFRDCDEGFLTVVLDFANLNVLLEDHLNRNLNRIKYRRPCLYVSGGSVMVVII